MPCSISIFQLETYYTSFLSSCVLFLCYNCNLDNLFQSELQQHGHFFSISFMFSGFSLLVHSHLVQSCAAIHTTLLPIHNIIVLPQLQQCSYSLTMTHPMSQNNHGDHYSQVWGVGGQKYYYACIHTCNILGCCKIV